MLWTDMRAPPKFAQIPDSQPITPKILGTNAKSHPPTFLVVLGCRGKSEGSLAFTDMQGALPWVDGSPG